MDGTMTERVQALKELLGPDATEKLLALYGDGQTTKAAGMRTSYKASSAMDQAIAGLTTALEAARGAKPDVDIIKWIEQATLQWQRSTGTTGGGATGTNKLSDSGPQSVAAKSTRPASTFTEFMLPGVPRT